MKRCTDLTGGILLILILSPVWIVLFGILTLTTKGKPLFLHLRPGRYGIPFIMYKFRTLNDSTDTNGNLLTDAERLTLIGKWLRRYSLDEIPQLINVIKGEMSIIGPRPLLMEYLPLYNPLQNRRHDVRPGITGLAQIKGRNSLSWKEKFDYDIWYVDHLCFKTDMLILAETLRVVISGCGISQNGHFSSEPFKGEGVKVNSE